jgi:transportin-1
MPPDAPAPPPGAAGPPPLAAANEAMFSSALAGVLARVGDRNRLVQQSACSALAVMQEHAGAATNGAALAPHLPVLLDTIAAGLQHYGRRTLRALLDALCTLAAVVGPPLGDPAIAQRFMPQVGCVRGGVDWVK